MSKIPLQQNKESLIGYGLFVGAFLLFLINAVLIIQTLIAVYGYKPKVNSLGSIDGTVISEAIQLINQDK